MSLTYDTTHSQVLVLLAVQISPCQQDHSCCVNYPNSHHYWCLCSFKYLYSVTPTSKSVALLAIVLHWPIDVHKSSIFIVLMGLLIISQHHLACWGSSSMQEMAVWSWAITCVNQLYPTTIVWHTARYQGVCLCICLKIGIVIQSGLQGKYACDWDLLHTQYIPYKLKAGLLCALILLHPYGPIPRTTWNTKHVLYTSNPDMD